MNVILECISKFIFGAGFCVSIAVFVALGWMAIDVVKDQVEKAIAEYRHKIWMNGYEAGYKDGKLGNPKRIK